MSTSVRLAIGTVVVALALVLACIDQSSAPTTSAELAVAVVSPAAIPVDTYVVTVKGPQTATLKGVPGGSVTFPGLKSGQYTVLVEGYRSGSLASFGVSSASVTRGARVSASVTVTSLKLVFTQQPTNAVAGQAINPAVKVTAQDSLGNINVNFGGIVTVAIGSNPGTATLGGTPNTLASAGVATFTGLSINKTGTGYTLVANSAQVQSGATSGTFNISVGPASTIAVNAGNGQSGSVNTVVAGPSVIVKDQVGNPVSGQSVTFAVTSGGGSISPTTPVTTLSTGIASLTSWKLGSAPGTNTITATATGLTGSPVMFTATGTAPDLVISAPALLTVTPTSISKGGTVTLSGFTVANEGNEASWEDVDGNALVDIGFYLSTDPTITSSDIALSGVALPGLLQPGQPVSVPARTLTIPNATGSGSYYIGALVDVPNSTPESNEGNNFKSTALTVTGAAASTIAINAGNGQSAIVNTFVATFPSVIVKDALGNPAAGTSVTFAVASGGGSITGTNPVTTGISGIAAISWKLGPTAGANSLTATATGLTGSPVTFTATGTAPADLVISAPPTLTATPLSVPPSGAFSLPAFTVTNQGAVASSASFSIGFYLSTDATITAADPFLNTGAVTVPQLAPGASVVVPSRFLSIPSTQASGNYFVGPLVDETNQTPESNEGNNFKSAAVTVLSPDQLNDVQVGSLGCPAGTQGRLYQSFTPTRSFLSGVTLFLEAGASFPAAGMNASMSVRVGSPSGTVLQTATVNIVGPQPPGRVLAILFQMSPPIAVTSGGAYVIEGPVITGDLSGRHNANVYTRGIAYSCDGGNVFGAGIDFSFITY